MSMKNKLALLTAIFSVLAANQSMAAGPAETVGNALSNLVNDVWNPMLLLITMASGLGGIYLMIKGLVRIAAAAHGGHGASQAHYGPALANIAFAAFLIALPQAAGVGITTLFGGQGMSSIQSSGLDYNDNGINGSYLSSLAGGLAQVTAPTNCLSDSQPAVCMSRNIAVNVIPMATMALFAMTFLAGLAIMASTILQWAKSMDKHEHGRGFVTRAITAILLMNASVLFRMTTTSVMGQSSPITDLGHLDAGSSLLTYPVSSSIEIVQKYAQLIGNAFTILVFFGAWAFIRGVFMIKSVAEAGRQGGSYGMASTYIVAGILLANAKFSTCLILATVGGADMGNGFCN